MPSGVYKRTKPSWNKNLTKETDERVARYGKKSGKSRKGKHRSDKTKQKISKSRLGIPPWNKDKTDIYSESTLYKMHKAALGNKYGLGYHRSEASKIKAKETQRKIMIERYAKMTKDQIREQVMPWILAGRKAAQTLEAKQKRSRTCRERLAKETKKERLDRLRSWMLAGQKVTRKLWQNKEFKNKKVKALLKGNSVKPNKVEKKLNVILQHIVPNEFKYVGDGQIIIDGKCPDFINCNGKKQIIELFGDYWHRGQTGLKKINHYKKYGYLTLIIWEHELKNLELLNQKIIQFVKN